jgi:hypothetical protein
MEAVRERWTDDRMDKRFERVAKNLAGLQTGQIELRKELSEKASRQEVTELRTELSQRFDRLQNMLLTGFFGLVATLILTHLA